tara:strand:+ start:2869 stop:3624 length:756 start_codon:yes stop_codon:yes gene_type:complete
MSKITDRISTSTAAEQARKHYETEQQSKLPSMIVPLSSGGKIYPKDHPLREGKIEMRYMTAYDEDILTNISYVQEGVMIDRLLESISLTKFNIDDMSTFDKDGLIVYARILSYGKDYPVTVTDPKTKNELDRVANLEKIQPKPFKLTTDDNGEFEYKTKNNTIKFTYNVKDISDLAPSQFCKTVITQVDDSRSAETIEQFIRYQFMALDSKKFRTYYVEHCPGLDMNLEFEGEHGGTFTAGFSIKSDFFWF